MHLARIQRRVQSRSAKAAANESKYPNIVELAVDGDGLDVTLGRSIWQPLKISSNSSVGSSANTRRGKTDRGEHRQAAGAIAASRQAD